MLRQQAFEPTGSNLHLEKEGVLQRQSSFEGVAKIPSFTVYILTFGKSARVETMFIGEVFDLKYKVSPHLLIYFVNQINFI